MVVLKHYLYKVGGHIATLEDISTFETNDKFLYYYYYLIKYCALVEVKMVDNRFSSIYNNIIPFLLGRRLYGWK